MIFRVPSLPRAPFDYLKRLAGFALSGFVVLACYGLGKLGEPALTLPHTQLDHAIPLIPWTIWIYGSGTKAALLAWLQVPNAVAGRKLFGTLALSSVCCAVVFILFPTTYPRELYPLPAGDSFTLTEFADLRDTDSPSNCLPSLHVALAWGLALNWHSFLRRFRWAPFAWALAVSVCTLTTKQHYLVDVPTGAAVGFASWYVVSKLSARQAAPLRLNLTDARPAEALLARVRSHQWRLADLPPFPSQPLPPLMVRLLNEVIYIEEIARLNFELLRDASDHPVLRELYAFFAEEERRHADGLRAILAAAGHPILSPGLGNSMILDQFDELHPDRDAPLVAVSNPVFETFLDAGTIPFLQAHPALQSPAFDAFVERVCADESAHLALNWMVTRQVAAHHQGWRGWRLLSNPNLLRGVGAVPWMSLEVYALAHRLGYNFGTLLPPFGRLWRLHERFPELAWFPLWQPFRLFVVAGAVATTTTMAMVRAKVLFPAFWVGVSRISGLWARFLYGDALLARRGLPRIGKMQRELRTP